MVVLKVLIETKCEILFAFMSDRFHPRMTALKSGMLLAVLTIAFEKYFKMTSLASSQNVPLGQRLKSNEEIVGVTIQATLKDSQIEIYPITTQHHLDIIHRAIRYFSNVKVSITRLAKPAIQLELQRNSAMIPKNFVKRYFMSDGEPVIERADPTQPFCYYTGLVSDPSSSLVSLNLCDGVEGVVELSQQKFMLKSIIKNGNVWHKLSKLLSTKQRSSMKCGTSQDDYRNYTNYYEYTKSRTSRQLQLGAGFNSSTRYIELYLVVDQHLYRRAGSIEATTKRALDIVNHVSLLYQKLNIYIALVGLEIWSDKNKIGFYRYRQNPSEYDSVKLVDGFSRYRYETINSHTSNDNAQLLVGVDLDYLVVGRATLGGICTHTVSAGITWDVDEDNYILTASIFTHELGHNLGFYHSDNNPYRTCTCRPSCIMQSTVGKN